MIETMEKDTFPMRWLSWSVALMLTVNLAAVMAQDAGPDTTQQSEAVSAADSEPEVSEASGFQVEFETPRKITDAWRKFGNLKLWEDGLSEMSYFDATCDIYGKKRSYTRVHLFNRQTMDEKQWIKSDDNTKNPIPVFKLVIAEEVPTDNYNYRFLTTAFVTKPDLAPFKVSITSQEWCGNTFKSLLWTRYKQFKPDDWAVDVCSYSYFPGEGDRWWPLRGHVDAYEFLFIFARSVVASGGEERPMHLVRSLRSNKLATPEYAHALLKTKGKPRKITVPYGTFEAQRVVLQWDESPAWFDVETKAPYRLLAFKADDVQAKLRFVERGAYWDPAFKSGFYKPGQAP